MSKISVYAKIELEYQTKRNMEIEKLHKSPSKRWYRGGIHILLRRADARASVDIIYCGRPIIYYM